jgi:hypothetical protein
LSKSRRIDAWRSRDELDHLVKLGSVELSHDLLNASLMEQQDSRDDGLGHALSGGPAHIVWMKTDVKTIRHAQEYIPVARRFVWAVEASSKEKRHHHNQCANPDPGLQLTHTS